MPRPRKPLEQHVREGTYKASRHGPLPEELQKLAASLKASPPPPIPMPEPSGAGTPEEASASAREFWSKVARLRSDIIQESDWAALTLMAEWWAQIELCIQDLRQAIPATRRDYLQNLKIATDAWEKVASKFGLLPADRARLLGQIMAPRDDGPKLETRPKTRMDSMGPPNLKIAGA